MRKKKYFIFYIALVIFMTTLFSCSDKHESEKIKNISNDSIRKIEEFVNLPESPPYLNQVIIFDKNNKIKKSSQYYEFNGENCLVYHSFNDTLNLELGKSRFIIFKTSDSLLKDFSNIDKLKLKDIHFKKNVLCFDKAKTKYGIIEDILFLPSDSIINGEESVRIIKNYMYINLEKPNLLRN